VPIETIYDPQNKQGGHMADEFVVNSLLTPETQKLVGTAFSDSESLVRWATRQETHWEATVRHTGLPGKLDYEALRRLLVHPFEEIRTRAAAGAIPAAVEILNRIGEHRLFVVAGREDRFLQRIRIGTGGPFRLIGALVALAGMDITDALDGLPNAEYMPLILQGHSMMIAFLVEPKTGADSRSRIEQVITEGQDAVVELSQAIGTARDRTQEAVEGIRATTSEAETRMNKAVAHFKAIEAAALESTRDQLEKHLSAGRQALSDADELKAQTAAQWDALLDARRKEMELRKPLEYWVARGRIHRWSAWVALSAFIALAAVVVLGVVMFGREIYDLVHPSMRSIQAGVGTASGAVQMATPPTFDLSGLALITVPALSVFWVMRMIGRIFVQNFNASLDAGHRAVLIETFLALVADSKSEMKDEERQHIIQAVFRPLGETADIPLPHVVEYAMGRMKGGKD
jgi:hypothetical protein